ncbi:MAG: DUF4105 domain-containing protein, partial [Rhodothermales bacterium]
DVRVSLLTILPGSDIYSLWGHSAIRVVDPSATLLGGLRPGNPRGGADVSFNYGTFDFNTDFFVARFLHGSLDYQLSLHDYRAAINHYRAEGRPVVEQTLDLTREQTERLVRFLTINLQPENRGYRYHFLFDNCSTRIRDALEAALGDALSFDGVPDPDMTFRHLIDPYQRAVPFLDAGIDLLLGAPVDRRALPYETMFLPDYLLAAFDRAAIEVDGARRPLVTRTDTLLWIDGYDRSPGSVPWASILAWSVFAAGLIATFRARRRQPVAGLVRSVDVPLLVVTGLAGVLIAYLWFISHHDVTEGNWHLLWAWPTHLLAGAALLVRGARVPRWLPPYLILSGIAAAVVVAGLPFWPQAFHPALVPVILLLALRGGAVLHAHRSRRGSSS